jgi:hypothetical protein
LFSTGRIRPDGLVLEASGASQRQAMVRLTTLSGMGVPRRGAPHPGAVRPSGRHRGAIGGMALFWAGDSLAVWSALAAFGLLMNGAALIVGYCTGMVVTRRTAPLAGAGTLTLILPLTIWASGAPLATAVVGVAACRHLGGWLSLPPALAGLPVLRETTRQAAGLPPEITGIG